MSKKQKKELTLEQDDLSLGLKDVPFPDVIKFVTTPASKVPSLEASPEFSESVTIIKFIFAVIIGFVMGIVQVEGAVAVGLGIILAKVLPIVYVVKFLNRASSEFNLSQKGSTITRANNDQTHIASDVVKEALVPTIFVYLASWIIAYNLFGSHSWPLFAP